MEAPPLIATPDELAKLAVSVARAGRLALDTEFVWERTYRPILGLVQIATDAGVSLIDPVALKDLSPLFPLLQDPKIPVVLHGGGQDLDIFAFLMGEPIGGVVDTQVEAAFLGYGLQVGLTVLLERVLKVRIKKDQTYTDWVRRPLRREQLVYAAEDVRHLLEMHDRLQADLDKRGRAAWAAEEMQLAERPERYVPTPADERYRSVKGWQRLGGRDLSVLRELAAWREKAAERVDVRPNFIANDVVLTSLAGRPPENANDLRNVRGLSSGTVDRHGKAILAAVHEGITCPAERWPEKPGRTHGRTPAPGLTALLRAAVHAVAEREDVAPEVIASGREIDALASYAAGATDAARDLAVTRGWRRELVGDTLLAIARGELGIRYDPSRRAVVGDPVTR